MAKDVYINPITMVKMELDIPKMAEGWQVDDEKMKDFVFDGRHSAYPAQYHSVKLFGYEETSPCSKKIDGYKGSGEDLIFMTHKTMKTYVDLKLSSDKGIGRESTPESRREARKGMDNVCVSYLALIPTIIHLHVPMSMFLDDLTVHTKKVKSLCWGHYDVFKLISEYENLVVKSVTMKKNKDGTYSYNENNIENLQKKDDIWRYVESIYNDGRKVLADRKKRAKAAKNKYKEIERMYLAAVAATETGAKSNSSPQPGFLF